MHIYIYHLCPGKMFNMLAFQIFTYFGLTLEVYKFQISARYITKYTCKSFYVNIYYIAYSIIFNIEKIYIFCTRRQN